MEIIIRENDSLPIYEQIVREVKKAIIKKEIMPGDMMPSIRALARELEISVITTKRAYEELEKEQLIYSVAGKGFYVKARNREKLKKITVALRYTPVNLESPTRVTASAKDSSISVSLL